MNCVLLLLDYLVRLFGIPRMCSRIFCRLYPMIFQIDYKTYTYVQFSRSVCPALCGPINCSTPGILIHHQLPEFTQTHVHWVGDAIQPSHPLSPIPPSIRVFSNESTLRMRWPKYWSFSFSIIPSKEHLGPISFRMDWLDVPAVQGILKSLLQHHSSKASILRHSEITLVTYF